jgi:hypothetical protein
MTTLAAVPSKAQEAGERGFVVSDWKAYSKNTLRGFLTITVPSGMVLRGCTLHEKEGARWIGLPAQKFLKGGGVTTYMPVVEFTTKEARDRFNSAALRALEKTMGV